MEETLTSFPLNGGSTVCMYIIWDELQDISLFQDVIYNILNTGSFSTF